MTATCRPGLPMVVRFLVRSRVRPAAAPESTWIAASRSGPPAPAGWGGAVGAGCGAAGVGGAPAGLGAEVCVVVGAGAGGDVSPMAFRPVWVSPMPFSAGVGGGAALAGLRMIMVFSKSAAVAAVGASLKYLSLCLPISTTSLFWRKCFLTGLPLTIVPLV